MNLEENAAGGVSVTLVAGDDLEAVPATHRHLTTPSVRRVFADPTAHFRATAERCNFLNMRRWLLALLSNGHWELELHTGFADHAAAGFSWNAEGVRGARIGLPVEGDLEAFPPPLRAYYALVDDVDWMGFGCPGALIGAAAQHESVTLLNYDFRGADVDLESTWIWGYSPCGDMIIYTDDDQGGWLSHETHQIRLIGTIADTINWVFGELLAERTPEFEY